MTVLEEYERYELISKSNYIKNIVIVFPQFIRYYIGLWKHIFSKEFYVNLFEAISPVIAILISPILLMIAPVTAKKDAKKFVKANYRFIRDNK